MTAEQPTLIEAPSNASIAVIAAHPDDMEFWCAGTVMRAIAQGCDARLLLVTSGDKGSGDPLTDARELAVRREREALDAGEIIGLSDVQFLRHLDGEIDNTLQLRREITTFLRRWQPEFVFTFDPVHPLPVYTSHRDHRTVGRATLDCIFPIARDPLNFPELLAEGIEPHKVAEAWLFASGVANRYVDIAATLDRKTAARIAHASQTSDPAVLPENWRRRAAAIGEPIGLNAAEAFTIVTLR